MSVAEIKTEMAKLPPGETAHLAAYARHLARRNEPGYAASLDAEGEQLENGARIAGTELRRLAGELDHLRVRADPRAESVAGLR